MRDSDLSNMVKLALSALFLVARGWSERTAIEHVTLRHPSLGAYKGEALALVLGALREQDLVDRIISEILPNERFGQRTVWLYRLATYMVMRSHDGQVLRQIDRSIRNLAPAEDLERLELLIGSALVHDPYDVESIATDPERVAFQTHCPLWWVEYCFQVFGRGEAVEMLSAPARPRYIRVNPLMNRGRVALPAQAKRLAKALTKVPSVPGTYYLNSSPSEFSQFFSRGLFQVQDLASFLAVQAADPEPGEKVLDLCAAPGAKTAATAQFMRNRGTILSIDYSKKRMDVWKREVSRLGVKIANPLIGDAANLPIHQTFDLIIIDPPCTGTGVVDRNPSMKWHLSPQSLEHYATLQRRFLEAASPLVAEEGRILYCTCTVTLEENERVVSTFLKSHPEFETRSVLRERGSPGRIGMDDCRRFYPHRDKTAGYFVARLERVN